MDKQIVIIANDERTVYIIRSCLNMEEGFTVKEASGGISGIKTVKDIIPDLIVLDLMLPRIDGLNVLQKIRKNPLTARIPIIAITAILDGPKRLLGLELGADDLLTKPFSPRELLARIKAILRRTCPKKENKPKHFYKTVFIDTESCTVIEDDKEILLTSKEYLLLKFFVENKGQALSRKVIIDNISLLSKNVTTKTVDVHVQRLRTKIPSLTKSIVTVNRIGYRLREE